MRGGFVFIERRRTDARFGVRSDGRRGRFVLDVDVDFVGTVGYAVVVVDARNASQRHVAFAADRMRHDVAAEVAVAPEHLLARRALVRLQVRVGEEMRLEVGSLVEAAGTDWALVRRLLQVQNAVDGQRPRLAETFAAIGAFERLLLRVNVTVEIKTGPLVDCLFQKDLIKSLE